MRSQAQEVVVTSQNQTPAPSQPASSSPSQPLTPVGAVNPIPGTAAGAQDGARPEISQGANPATEAPADAAQTAAEKPLAGTTSEVAATPETTASTAPNADVANPQASTGDSIQATKQPEIRLRVFVDGKVRQASVAVTSKLTVGQALAAIGVSLSALDRCSPEASTAAHDLTTVRVTRIKAVLQTRRTPVEPEVRYQPTTVIAPGRKQTVQEPKPGYYEITERVWYRDGKATKREFVSRRLAQPAQDRIIALGVKPHLMPGAIQYHRRYALAARGGSPRDRVLQPANPATFQPIRSLNMHATGYAAGPAGGAISNYTCTGVRCTYGAVAVDPRVIPLGSKLYIEGYGYGFACDTGGAIRGRHIDLAFDSARDAMRHGRKNVKVWVLGP
jgi:3D (Asp-Asp-Asp) domain-containing protein